MLAANNVSADDIAYAERILLPPGELFDEERIRFIKDMGTLDLQAVPGSGKTTALLAKLLILDRRLPFSDGSGVLVISHTNAAIDEIRDRIGAHCTNLFRHPNFVGTIQSFVDEFLAVPFYANKYGRVPTRIDDDIYEQKFSDPPFGISGFIYQENKNARRFLIANKNKKIRWTYVDGKPSLSDGYSGQIIEFKKPRARTNPEKYEDWTDTEKNRVRQWVNEFKLAILKSGCLCYDDAYFLARLALSKNPRLKLLLQKRFSRVFVDEMQDMEEHQHALLEDIFYDGGESTSAYQRIGDKNQSIFDGRRESNNVFWRDREKVLELNGSYRLSPILARVVSAFAVSPIRIEGRKRDPGGSDISIKPRFIVYTDSTKSLAIPCFASLIRDHLDDGLIPESPRNRYKAVAWATQPDNNKVRLPDYFPSYARTEQQKRIDHPDMASYFSSQIHEKYSFAPIEAAINNALLRILRLEEAQDTSGTNFTKRTMHEFIRNVHPTYWDEYRSKIHRWCLGIARGSTGAVLAEMREHLPTFLSKFDRQIKKCRDFLSSPGSGSQGSTETAVAVTANIMACRGFNIEVATVHRVKGETHTATLYMETFYEKGGGGNYESERLAGQFKGQPVGCTPHAFVRQSAKMVYVGFSRPTHLLCFAVHENRFAKLRDDIDQGTWDMVYL
ncbi:MAG: ATP-dependent helicase [Myxococcales bacterium]|nr:ATP-dependent helicase [Myxococcales bacterium]